MSNKKVRSRAQKPQQYAEAMAAQPAPETVSPAPESAPEVAAASEAAPKPQRAVRSSVDILPPVKQTAAASYAFFPAVDIRETARLLKRRIQIIGRLTVLCTVTGFLMSMIVAPRYASEAVLLLDQRQAKLMDTSAVLPAMPSTNAAVRTEMDIITSRAVIDRVVRRLNLLADPDFAPREGFLDKLNPARLFGKEEPQDPAAQRQHQLTSIADAIINKLSVTNDGLSYSIHVGFEAKNPQKAALIANTVADEYLVDQLEAKYEVTARANKWLSERLADLRKQVEISEKAVENFREKANLIQIGDGSTIAVKQMQEINTQLITARAATSQAEARLRSAQSTVSSGGSIEGAADVLSSPLIVRLREQEAEIRRKEAELSTRYGERHPTLINARAERQDLQRKIQEEVQKILHSLSSEVEIARAKENTLQGDLRRLESKAGGELKASVQLRQLQRDADANRTLYENFLGRFKQTSEQQDMQIPDTRVIARAEVPVQPTSPKKWMFIILGAMLGGTLGVAAAYLIEFMDRGFRTSPQFEEVTGVAVVGQVPSLKGVTQRTPEAYVVDKPLSAFSESLRTVRTAIHFSNVDHPPKTVMVTSSSPGEGKTTFCLSLARSLAIGGNRILLIDADLRRPRVARALGIAANGRDLSAILTGKYPLAQVVRQDTGVPNLDVIPAFGRAPNAQDLLGSQQMKKLITEMRDQYDLVLIDTPPILAVTDAAMVARAADTSLFIVKWAETSRDTVAQAMRQLKGLDCRLAGAVLNQVNLTELASYGDGYYNQKYHDYYTD